MPGGAHENMRGWSPEEDELLLRLIEVPFDLLEPSTADPTNCMPLHQCILPINLYL